jgi:hypothetical protein
LFLGSLDFGSDLNGDVTVFAAGLRAEAWGIGYTDARVVESCLGHFQHISDSKAEDVAHIHAWHFPVGDEGHGNLVVGTAPLLGLDVGLKLKVA